MHARKFVFTCEEATIDKIHTTEEWAMADARFGERTETTWFWNKETRFWYGIRRIWQGVENKKTKAMQPKLVWGYLTWEVEFGRYGNEVEETWGQDACGLPFVIYEIYDEEGNEDEQDGAVWKINHGEYKSKQIPLIRNRRAMGRRLPGKMVLWTPDTYGLESLGRTKQWREFWESQWAYWKKKAVEYPYHVWLITDERMVVVEKEKCQKLSQADIDRWVWKGKVGQYKLLGGYQEL